MRYVFVGDDFTGASDTLATLARAGLKVRLFREVPSPEEVAGLDAFGLATHARAMGPEELADLLRDIGPALAAHNPQILHVKVCSTFDSSAKIGNFVTLAEGLAEATGIVDLAVLGGQPSLGRYAVFGTLFAKGPDGFVHRIDRHPVMSCHPVTPMCEADLTRHLGALGLCGLHLVPRGAQGERFPRLYDALEQGDITAVGRDLFSAPGPVLVIGASSVAEAWLASLGITEETASVASPPDRAPTARPVFAFAGSRSSVTTAQIAAASGYWRLPVNPADMMAAGAALAEARRWAEERLERGESCLIYLTADHAGEISPAELARAAADFVADVLVGRTLGGLVVAGGDTSGAIVQRLAIRWLDYEAQVCAGVPLLTCDGPFGPLDLALKGGQMGPRDFFDQAMSLLQRRTR